MKTRFLKTMAVFGILAASFLSGGCFSIQHSSIDSTGEEHVFVSNYGWYLFGGVVPVACGNAAENASIGFVLFRDDVTMDKIQRRFMEYADKADKNEIDNLSYHNYATVLFDIPGLDIPFPIPYIITYKEIQLSGVLK